ncbi:MAG: HAMP domain-containing sensor histidine kinase, partial [Planctomycetota bacterium]
IELYTPRDFERSVGWATSVIRRVALAISVLTIMFTLFVLREVKRKQLAAAELSASNDELRRANRQKDRLLSIIAHDVRAPLSGVTQLSGLLISHPEEISKDELREYGGQIQTTSKELTEMLENLLNWARLQTGRLPLVPGIIDIEKVVRQITTLFDTLARGRSIRLTGECPSRLQVVADNEMLRTILRNLVSNAIKYNEDGGSVGLSVGENDSEILFEVSDSGFGIAEDELADLFAVSDAPKHPSGDNGKGSGFGLALSQQLARRMNGSITVTSTPGHGSTFTLRLPRSMVESMPSQEESNGSRSNESEGVI